MPRCPVCKETETMQTQPEYGGKLVEGSAVISDKLQRLTRLRDPEVQPLYKSSAG